MKIYTYYQDINFNEQNELIDLWKISWSRQGYEPMVLNLEDAKKHPYFETLNREMRKISQEITGKQTGDYGMSCWFRWLAYAMQKEDSFYVSDYDAINVNFQITEPKDKLHLMDNDCPFLASGTPTQFELLCKAFVEVSNERIEILKQQTDHYHDQDFFHLNFMPQNNDSAEDLRNQHGILMSRNRYDFGGHVDHLNDKVLAGPNIGYIEKEKYKVVHVSHLNCSHQFELYPHLKKNHTRESLRIAMIKGLLEL